MVQHFETLAPGSSSVYYASFHVPVFDHFPTANERRKLCYILLDIAQTESIWFWSFDQLGSMVRKVVKKS